MGKWESLKKEGYQQLNTIGTPSRALEVNDDVFLSDNKLLHTHMSPNFKKQPKTPRDHEYTSKLNLFTGRNLKPMLDRPNKKENPPLFKPFKEEYLPNRNYVMNNVLAQGSRFKDETGPNSRKFEAPTPAIRVPKGVDIGYNAEGDDRPFHPWYRPEEQTIDELTGEVRPTYQINRNNIGRKGDKMHQMPKPSTKRPEALFGIDFSTIIPGLGAFSQNAPKEGQINNKGDKKMDTIEYIGNMNSNMSKKGQYGKIRTANKQATENKTVMTGIKAFLHKTKSLFTANTVDSTMEERAGGTNPIVFTSENGRKRGINTQSENKKISKIDRNGVSKPIIYTEQNGRKRGNNTKPDNKKRTDLVQTGQYDMGGLGGEIIYNPTVKDVKNIAFPIAGAPHENRTTNYQKEFREFKNKKMGHKNAPQLQMDGNNNPLHLSDMFDEIDFTDDTSFQQTGNFTDIGNDNGGHLINRGMKDPKNSYMNVREVRTGNLSGKAKNNYEMDNVFAPTTRKEGLAQKYQGNAGANNPKQFINNNHNNTKLSKTGYVGGRSGNGGAKTNNIWGDTEYMGLSRTGIDRLAADAGPRPLPNNPTGDHYGYNNQIIMGQNTRRQRELATNSRLSLETKNKQFHKPIMKFKVGN